MVYGEVVDDGNTRRYSTTMAGGGGTRPLGVGEMEHAGGRRGTKEDITGVKEGDIFFFEKRRSLFNDFN